MSGIFITPTIDVDKSEVKKGDNIAIFGQTVPKSEVTIQINSDNPIFAKTESSIEGAYLYNLDTALLEYGQHFTKSKSAINGEISSFGKAISFTVGAKTVAKIAESETLPSTQKVGDINRDTRINLIDFSIMAYWWSRPFTEATKKVDLNNDGKINLVDFSILAYYWTG